MSIILRRHNLVISAGPFKRRQLAKLNLSLACNMTKVTEIGQAPLEICVGDVLLLFGPDSYAHTAAFKRCLCACQVFLLYY